MFETLTGRLNQVFDQLRRRGKLSEADVDAAMREVRLALLEADVHYSVVKEFIARVRGRAVGAEVSKALNPGQQVVKIVNEELIGTLGEPEPLNLSGPKPRVLMLVGLQGSGKTTAAGKLARLLRSKGERVMLVAGDPYRPAAVQQLQQLGERLDVSVEAASGVKPPDLAARAYDKAQKGRFSVMASRKRTSCFSANCSVSRSLCRFIFSSRPSANASHRCSTSVSLCGRVMTSTAICS